VPTAVTAYTQFSYITHQQTPPPLCIWLTAV